MTRRESNKVQCHLLSVHNSSINRLLDPRPLNKQALTRSLPLNPVPTGTLQRQLHYVNDQPSTATVPVQGTAA